MDIKHGSIKGFTLVEVMVAMLITFIVLGGVYQSITRETLDVEKEEIILDMQNNARSGIDRIAREIRRSGFLGCGGDLNKNLLSNAGTDETLISDLTIGINPPGTVWDGDNSILDEIKANGGANLDYLAASLAFYDNAAALHGLYEEGTDAISLVYLSGDIPQDPGNVMANSSDNPIHLAVQGFSQWDIMYITDCEDYSMFQKTDGDNNQSLKHDKNTGLNINSLDLGKAYGSTAQARVFKYNISTFFVARENPLDPNSDPELFHNSIHTAIASNIEDLQFEFKFDEDNDNDLADEDWRDSFTVGATTFKPEDARAVRVWVLAMSDKVYSYTNTETYDYPNSPYYSAANPFGSANGAGGAPGDNRYRYLASAEIYLRNAGL